MGSTAIWPGSEYCLHLWLGEVPAQRKGTAALSLIMGNASRDVGAWPLPRPLAVWSRILVAKGTGRLRPHWHWEAVAPEALAQGCARLIRYREKADCQI